MSSFILLSFASLSSAFHLQSLPEYNCFKRDGLNCKSYVDLHSQGRCVIAKSCLLVNNFGICRPRPKAGFALSSTDTGSDMNQEGAVRVDVRTEDIEFNSVHELKQDAVDLVNAALFHDSVPSETELSIVLCSDPFIQSLNKQWRGKDKATDVLSFPQDDEDEIILGDLVISVPTATRQVYRCVFLYLPSSADRES